MGVRYGRPHRVWFQLNIKEDATGSDGAAARVERRVRAERRFVADLDTFTDAVSLHPASVAPPPTASIPVAVNSEVVLSLDQYVSQLTDEHVVGAPGSGLTVGDAVGDTWKLLPTGFFAAASATDEEHMATTVLTVLAERLMKGEVVIPGPRTAAPPSPSSPPPAGTEEAAKKRFDTWQ